MTALDCAHFAAQGSDLRRERAGLRAGPAARVQMAQQPVRLFERARQFGEPAGALGGSTEALGTSIGHGRS